MGLRGQTDHIRAFFVLLGVIRVLGQGLIAAHDQSFVENSLACGIEMFIVH